MPATGLGRGGGLYKDKNTEQKKEIISKPYQGKRKKIKEKGKKSFSTNSDFLYLYSCNPTIYMSFVRSNNLILKYQRFAPLDCKDFVIRKHDFMEKTQFPL